MTNKKIKKIITSLRLNHEIWNKFRILCFKKQKYVSEYIEELMDEELKKDEKEK